MINLKPLDIDTKFSPNKLVWSTIAVLFLVYPCLDFIRKLLPLSPVIYVLQDLMILFLYIVMLLVFMRKQKFEGRYSIRSPIKSNGMLILFLVLLLFSLMLSSLMSKINSPILSILGTRTYLLGIPMLFWGYSSLDVFQSTGFLRKANQLLTFIVWFIIFVSILQFAGKATGASILPALEHEIHSFGTSEISLHSSVFVSSKKYARYLLFTFVLLSIVRNQLGLKMGLITPVFLLGVLISGSRESFVLAFIFIVLVFLRRRSKVKFKGRVIPQKVKEITFFTLALSLITVLVQFVERFQFIIATDDSLSYVRRVLQFFPFLWIDWTNPEVWTGLGPGSYGQETKLIPGIRDRLEGSAEAVFSQSLSIGASLITFVDSGLTRIVMELGFLGIMSYVILIVMISKLAWKCLSGRVSDIYFALSCLSIFWVVLFLKAHQVLADIFISMIFYFSLGLLFKVLRASQNNRTDCGYT